MTQARVRTHALLASAAELVLLALVLTGLVFAVIFFHANGRLPQPFIFDTYDTFMDWFNTAFWAHNRGEYDVWKSVYPPLSFVFLRVAGLGGCYAISSVTARDCDWLGITAILCSYVACVVAASVSFWRNDRRSAPFRSLAIAFGLPLLFTLERGNLIIVAFPFFVLAHGPLPVSRWVRAIATAVTINFKPYLLIPAIGWGVARRWTTLELAALASAFLLFVTWSLNGAGSIAELAYNTSNFVQFTSGLLYEALFYSTSYAPFLRFDTYLFPTRDYIPTQVVDAITAFVPITIVATQAIVTLCLAGAFVQPGVLRHQRLAALLIGGYLISQSPGGYASLFLIYLVFLEKDAGIGVIVAVAAAYLVSIPFDQNLGELFAIDNPSWLANRDVRGSFGISLGLFLRPGGLIVIMWALALDGLHRIVLAHRARRPTLDPHPSALSPLPARS